MDETLKMRISPPENLHITLKFLGSVEQENIKFVQAAIAEIGNTHQRFKLRSTGLGFFKNSLWIGIEENDYLEQLVASMSQAFVAQSYIDDPRAFVPHVTLARFDHRAKTALAKLAETYADHNWGEFEVEQLHLYKSETLEEGARYTILNSYDCLSET